MEHTMSPLTRLGKTVAEAQDRALARTPLRVRMDDLHAVRRPRPSHRRLLVSALAAALLLSVGAVLFMVRSSPLPLTFQTGAEPEPGRVGAWLAASEGVDIPIHFSDGTKLDLAGGSRARIAAVYQEGADIVLEKGQLTADVVHRERTRWTVAVGPFEVHVVGTRFAVSWDAGLETLDLTLHEGAVVVTGPKLGDGRSVRAGETLHISAPIEAAPSAAPLAATAVPVPTTPSAPTHAAPSLSETTAPPPPLPAPAPPSFRDLAIQGQYRDALAAAEAEGFEGLCEGASAADLSLLGDTARYAGSVGRARQAYTALRRRFPGDPRAGSAAFVLGRIAFEQAGAYAEAATWFSTYLREQPGGALAREAAGRIMEARERSGDMAGARAAAESYLASYPTGPHAAKAKGLLESAP